MTRTSVARAVARKDLAVELGSRVLINQVAPFALVVMVMFAFALDNEGILQRVAPGLVWLATLFSMLVVVQRGFAVESADGALDALRVAGVDPVAIFLGKSAALMVQLFALEVLLVCTAFVLYGVEPTPAGWAEAFVTMVAATVGLGFVGTLYGGLAAGARAARLCSAAAPAGRGTRPHRRHPCHRGGLRQWRRIRLRGWPWIGLLAVFAVLFGAAGSAAFGPLVDE